ncbi:RAB6-interacting golgin isoform X2 [Peromyscus leucopus]|uniref:RAB6-interacting golgin isoform X2 n=1 Tax=Peromyscus leucopus TaxID=10041 RepID=UPI0010A10B35|nr:RAB6-interacting golgin isoform X2 [Peromyscus leucopus]
MAQDWAGFSEEELRRLKQNKDLFEPQRRLPVKKTRQQLQREKALLEQSQKLGLQDASASLPPEQLLSAPTQKVTNQKPRPSPAVSSPLTPASSTGNGKPQGIESQPQEPGLQNSQDGHRNAEVLTPKPNCKVEKKKMELQEKSRWEVLQQEQRLMEEKNKRKKALLAQAIAERKRFDRAEAEYITAKLDLQRKTETKEQLTEHLCTIIQQNELRKAKKLEELMQQLDVQADEEALELELEVEQLLQEQEAEAGKQVVPVERHCQPAVESVSAGVAGENKEPQEQAASPEADKPGKHSSRPPLRPDCPGQGAKNFSAAVAT